MAGSASGMSKSVKSGARHEAQAAKEFGGSKVSHYVSGMEEHAEMGALRGFRRKHDLQISAGHFMEVKSGTQGPTLRVMKQIERDRLLINQQKITGVKSVRWLFYTKDGSTKGIHPSILKELDNNNIMWHVAKSPFLK
jgi:hypothetical protein